MRQEDIVIPTWSGMVWSRFHDMSVITAEETLFEAADELDEQIFEERRTGIGLLAEPEEILTALAALIYHSLGYGIARGWNVDGAVEAYIKGERDMEKYL